MLGGCGRRASRCGASSALGILLNAVRDELVWIDCEMTGLDLGSDRLIEIAALVTDAELNILGDGVDVVIHADDAGVGRHGRRRRADALQVGPHRGGARVDRRPGGGRDSWSSTTSASTSSRPTRRRCAGNSIATDRGFIARDMPALDAFLHYRMIDVSSIKELCRRWYPRIYFGQPDEGPRPPRARRHPRVDPGAEVLPPHRVRDPARALDQRHRRGGCRARAARRGAGRQWIRPRSVRAAKIDDAAVPDRVGGDGGCSSVGRAPGCDPGCRGFESRQPPHRSEGVSALRLFAFLSAMPGRNDDAAAR